MKTPTWYPAADERRCSGSFKTGLQPPDRDGKIECGVCFRMVGMRNPRTRQLAQHLRPAPIVSIDIETVPGPVMVVEQKANPPLVIPFSHGAPASLKNLFGVFEAATGVSVDRALDAVGDPAKERSLLLEVSENARPKDDAFVQSLLDEGRHSHTLNGLLDRYKTRK